jgi:hypothetical protein
MRAAAAICLYALSVFAIGALASYPAYLILAGLGATAPFHEVVIRTLKALALLGLIPLMGALRLQRLPSWGYRGPPGRFLCEVSVGLGAGVAISLALVLALIALEVRVVNPRFEWSPLAVLVLLLKALVTAAVVSTVEETWFRGALYSAIAASAGAGWAIGASALLFGAVHFIDAEPSSAGVAPDWTSGFGVVAGAFEPFASVAIVDSLLALSAAGLLLALVRSRTGTIAYCIGIHAGWVIVIKLAKKATHVDRGAEWSSLVGAYDGFNGYLACAWLLLLSAACFRLRARRRPAP